MSDLDALLIIAVAFGAVALLVKIVFAALRRL